MVRETQLTGDKAYQCEECELHFTDKHTAQDCEKWCATHDSCNYPIASQSIEATQ